MRLFAVVVVWLVGLASCGVDRSAPEPTGTPRGASQPIVKTPRAPCPRSATPCVDMYIAAHEDDDLLFMNPDIMNSIDQGNRVVVVHVTAGDLTAADRHGPPLDLDQYWIDRERGVLNAYAYMARGADHAFAAYAPPTQVPDSWRLVGDAPSTTAITVDGVQLTQYDLIDDPSHQISLVFLRLSDLQLENAWTNQPGLGGAFGARPGYVRHLGPGEVQTLACDGHMACPLGSQLPAQILGRDQLIDVLRDLMLRFQASSVSAQDSTNLYADAVHGRGGCGHGPAPAGTCGRYDYWDHVYSSSFTLAAAAEAQAAMSHTLWLRQYRGYTLSQEPANLSVDEARRKARVFHRQAVFDAKIMRHDDHGPDADGTAGDTAYNPAYAFSWQTRQLATRTLVGTASLQGRLRANDGCLWTHGAAPTWANCADAPSWILTTTNQIQLAGTAQCLEVTPGGGAADPVALAPCAAGAPGQILFVFGNGQIRTVGGRCLTSDGVAMDCDRATDFGHAAGRPTPIQDWTLIFDDAQLVSSQFDHAALAGSPSYYQTFQLVHRHLCAREAGGLYCAASDGDPLAPSLLPQALVSDIYRDDMDWRHAAYGATVAAAWQGATGSLIACGRGIDGLVCSSGLRSPDYADAAGWRTRASYYRSLRYLDLYGNGLISACGRAATGVACSVNIGGSWAATALWSPGFADDQGFGEPGTGDTLQYADVDGDGRIDVCGRGPSGISCAVMMKQAPFAGFIYMHAWSFDEDRSNAAAAPDFSNRDPAAAWSSSPAYYGSIRLVDLNRDGFADVCGRTPAGLACAFSTGSSFERARLVAPLDFTDAQGWSDPAFGST
ncbi:MAG TPA: hypothetical protein VGC42_00015, partial [Kofleriaceae bacterium]